MRENGRGHHQITCARFSRPRRCRDCNSFQPDQTRTPKCSRYAPLPYESQAGYELSTVLGEVHSTLRRRWRQSAISRQKRLV